MSPSTETRERRELAYELKFLLSPAVADQIRDWVRGRLAPDPHAGGCADDEYRITSLYFDTPEFATFHRRGSYGRSKFRIRRYGNGEVVFLERKARARGQLSKRRSLVPLEDLERLGGSAADRGWTGCWFHRRLQLRRLDPVCQISYDRAARVAMTDNGPIRLTLDMNLRALPAAGLWFNERAGDVLLPDRVVLELKFLRESPVVFKCLVEEFALNPEPFSKYRLAAASLGRVPVLAPDAATLSA